MTRTYLIDLARTIKKRNTSSYILLNTENWEVYNGRFLNNWIHCVFNSVKLPVAVYYKRVFYAIRPVSKSEAAILKDLYIRYLCHTKVFLYPNNHYVLFIDQQGRFTDKTYHGKANDYSDLIPLRSTLNVHA